jgi:hypothetical protein
VSTTPKYGRRLGAALVLVVCIVGTTGCMTTPNAGEIGVVRNGGPFDNHNIRQVVPNGSGNTWNGWFSSTHYYPVDSQQRFFKMERCYGQDKCDADAAAVTVPTSDGVEVTIEGTFYLNTVFNNAKGGVAAVKAFDTQFATRTFGSDGQHAYDGNGGWASFLGAIVEPIVVNNLRETVAGVQCAELVSSCALVQNQTGDAEAAAKLVTGKNNAANVARVQDAVSTGLANDLDSTLKRRYFGNIAFKLNRVVLPGKVQNAINDAQSAFAAVSQAQARIRSAQADAEANAARQAGYDKCQTCARIDAIKALPRGLTALGGNFALAVK